MSSSSTVCLQVVQYVFNVVRVTERMPQGWQEGVVVCLPKSGDLSKCTKYRGLTLLPCISKLFNISLTGRLSAFVHLNDKQYGFRKGRSTHDAMLVLHAAVAPRLQQRLVTYLLFLDWSKAYDRTMHSAFLDKLADKGVQSKAWRLVDAVHTNASSKVRLEGHMSEFFPVHCGVAQGDPLSPFLYAVFADGLLDKLDAISAECGVHVNGQHFAGQSYADDTVGLAGTAVHFQRLIDAVKEHGDEWGCLANVDKTVCMRVGKPDVISELPEEHFLWGSAELKQVTKEKYLGVVLSSDWAWDKHVDSVMAKGAGAVNSWARLLTTASRWAPKCA